MRIYPNMPAPEKAYNRVADMLLMQTHYKETSDNEQAQLRDLLTDIRHYADFRGLDLYGALEGSYPVYLEERHADNSAQGH